MGCPGSGVCKERGIQRKEYRESEGYREGSTESNGSSAKEPAKSDGKGR